MSGEHSAIATNDGSPSLTHAVASPDGVPGLAQHGSPVHPQVRLEEPCSDTPNTIGVHEVGGRVSYDEASHIQTVYNTPETILSEYLTTDLASTRWLDLLATDAAQADKGFSLPPTRHPSPAPGDLSFAYDASQTNLQDLNTAVSHAQAQTALLQPGDGGLSRLSHAVQANDGAAIATSERHAWQLEQNICLQDHEVKLFRTFAESASQWLDVFDPVKHFSTHATRLAVRPHTDRLPLPIMKSRPFLTLISRINSYEI